MVLYMVKNNRLNKLGQRDKKKKKSCKNIHTYVYKNRHAVALCAFTALIIIGILFDATHMWVS